MNCGLVIGTKLTSGLTLPYPQLLVKEATQDSLPRGSNATYAGTSTDLV